MDKINEIQKQVNSLIIDILDEHKGAYSKIETPPAEYADLSKKTDITVGIFKIESTIF